MQARATISRFQFPLEDWGQNLEDIAPVIGKGWRPAKNPLGNRGPSNGRSLFG
jgi:hypothetical protein